MTAVDLVSRQLQHRPLNPWLNPIALAGDAAAIEVSSAVALAFRDDIVPGTARTPVRSIVPGRIDMFQNRGAVDPEAHAEHAAP
jgi:hypothetical protein